MTWQWIQTALLVCIVALQIFSLKETEKKSDYELCVEMQVNSIRGEFPTHTQTTAEGVASITCLNTMNR